MGYVIKIPNYFKLHEHTKERVAVITISEYLQLRHPGWTAFQLPTIVQINGRALTQDQYKDTVIQIDDIVTFTVLLGDVTTLLYIAIASLIATAVTLAFAPQPPKIGDEPDADPSFSLRGQVNANKLGKAVPCAFGYTKVYPDLGARSYNSTIGNEQFQFTLYELSHGYVEPTELQLEDTPIANYADVEFEIYYPGELVTLFRDAVVTAPEVINIELYGPGHPSYDPAGYGPFIINDVGTTIDRIEIDINFPQGLYVLNSKGKIKLQLVEWQIEYQEIDDFGVAVGGWVIHTTGYSSHASRTAQRETFGLDVTAGRYQVRGFRITPNRTASNTVDTLYWEAVRGFLPNVQDYPNKTMIAVKAKASNNLNDQINARFNCRQQRRLPVYDLVTKLPGVLVASRSPVDAFIEILTASYGANLPIELIDLESLYELKAELESDNTNFDFVYENQANVWDASKLALSVGRAIPIITGSNISAIRDTFAEIPSAVFTPQNIIRGSFEWSMSFFKLNDPDGLEIKFIDEVTWKPRTILCTVGDEVGNRPSRVNLTGITNPDKAYREGLYRRAGVVFKRERYAFTTGLEGHLPALNALVKLSHDLPRWGKSGFVQTYTESQVTIDQEITMELGPVYVISFKTRTGEATDSYIVEYNSESSNILTIVGAWDNNDLQRNSNEEAPSYIFGEQNEEGINARVVSITPTNNDLVKIECVNEDSRVYSYDEVNAPAINTPPVRVEPDLPVVASINVNPITGSLDFAQVSWPPALGATIYTLEISYDGVTFDTLQTTATSYILQVSSSDTATIRVAGINKGTGPYQTWTGTVGIPIIVPETVTGLLVQPAFTGLIANLKWDADIFATAYNVEIYTSGILRCTNQVTTNSYDFGIDEAVACGGVNREIRFDVTAINDIGAAVAPATITETNPSPAKLEVFVFYIADTDESFEYSLGWLITTDSDFAFYRVWTSDTQGFTPGAGNLYYEGLTRPVPFFNIKDVNGKTPTIYIRAAAYDVWGEEVNLSDEVVITGTQVILTDGTNNLTDGTNNLTN